MSLAMIFHLSLYGLVAYAGWMLGYSEEGPIPYGTVVLAPLGYLWIELRKYRGLEGWVANLCGAVALGFAGNEFFSGGPEGKLLSGAHLIVYLSWIVLLQAKNDRHYWALCALSLLQVAVTAVLSSGASWFGPFMVFFLFYAMWTLSVFSLYQAETQFANGGLTGARPAPPQTADAASAPLLSTGESRVRDQLQIEDGRRWITPQFIGGVVAMSGVALVVGSVFFTWIPRVWIGNRTYFSDTDTADNQRRATLTGFTNTVRLGDLGQILESVKPVMAVEIFDDENHETVPVETFAQSLGYAEPLFRGALMTGYTRGQWRSEPGHDYNKSMLRFPNAKRNPLRQRVLLEPIGTDVLFHIGSASACDLQSSLEKRVYRQIDSELLLRDKSLSSADPLAYHVYVDRPASVPRRVPRVVVDPETRERIEKSYVNICKILPEVGLTPLKELSDRVIQDAGAGGRELTPLDKAIALETYLRDSGNFHYSLDAGVKDAKIDPVVDFIINRKKGHCEYFASALAIMLRQQDIPARLVSGFKGGQLNSVTNAYEVQQRHAHAWVEAYIRGDGISYWAVLDPTPSAERAASVAQVEDSRSLFEKIASLFADFWSRNVANISLAQQEMTLYGPLRDIALQAWKNAAGWASRTGIFLLAFWDVLTSPEYWSSGQGGATLIVFLVAVTALGWSLYRYGKQWARWSAGRSRRNLRGRIVVDFYERMLQILRKAGLEREATQTPGEFVASILNNPTAKLPLLEAGDVLPMLTAQYYAVRFGDTTLPDAEVDRIASVLESLDRAVTSAATNRSHAMANG